MVVEGSGGNGDAARMEKGVDGDSRSSKPRYLVLIAEDEPNNRVILQSVVEDFVGARAVLVADGGAAMAAVQHERPDLILLDLMMPVLDGFAVARQLKGDPATSSIPIIALTVMSRVEDQDAARQAGCDAFIAKPFDLDDVEQIIRTHLGLS